jgi:hypothetical protein
LAVLARAARTGCRVIEFPYQEAKEILARAAQARGHSGEISEALAQSAWWLENRGFEGVRHLIAYLDATRDRRPADLGAKRDEYGSVRCICPITAAAAIMAEHSLHVDEDSAGDLPVEYGLYGGPASPLIMGAVLAFYADALGLAVRLRFEGHSVVLSRDFAAVDEAGDPETLMRLDPQAEAPVEVEFLPLNGLKPQGQMQPYHRKLRLALPAARLGPGGVLTQL